MLSRRFSIADNWWSSLIDLGRPPDLFIISWASVCSCAPRRGQVGHLLFFFFFFGKDPPLKQLSWIFLTHSRPTCEFFAFVAEGGGLLKPAQEKAVFLRGDHLRGASPAEDRVFFRGLDLFSRKRFFFFSESFSTQFLPKPHPPLHPADETWWDLTRGF